MTRRKGKAWRRIASTLFSISTLFFSNQLLAEPRNTAKPRNTEAASRRFQAGVELYQEGSLDAALVEFERAYELMPSYRLLYNMAQIQAERHDYVAAVDLFERYLADGGRDLSKERRKEVRSELERLRGRVAFLIVQSNVDGAEVYLGDRQLGTLPIRRELTINPGKHKLRVKKSGFHPIERWIKAASGDEVRLQLQLVPDKTGPDVMARTDAPSPEPTADYFPFGIAAGAAGVLAASAGIFGLLTLSAKRDLDKELESFPSDTSAAENARDRSKTYALLADGAGLGAAIVGVLAVYYLLDPPDAEKRPAQTAFSGLRVLPRLSGVTCVAEF